nr:MAHS [Acutuncus antarcticus]
MARYLLHDIRAILRGVKKVAETGFKYQTEELSQRLSSSSLRPLAQNVFSSATKNSSQVGFWKKKSGHYRIFFIVQMPNSIKYKK